MAKKVNIVGKSLERIQITGPGLPRVEADEFAEALGAEPSRERHSTPSDLISLGELGNELLKRLRSTGGRPALEGATERCKVPLSPSDIAHLEQIIATIEAKTGTRPALGQIASVILQIHLNSLRASPAKKRHAAGESKGGRKAVGRPGRA
jgi:hypothetical protein